MRQERRSKEQWQAIGREAIVDLLGDRFVAPWAEIEARISQRGWKEFPTVQPVQLSGARRELREQGLVIEETSKTTPSVTTVRLPYPAGKKKEFQRLCGRRRKKYRKYLSWAADELLCGRHAEHVVLDSAKAAASEARLWVPPQTVGKIEHVGGIRVRKGPLDVFAEILEAAPRPKFAMDLVFEVKNIHAWVYPWNKPLWELLVKAADLALSVPVMAVLVCVRAHWQTGQLAKDLGFLACQLRSQLFSLSLEENEFDEMVDEFGLVMQRHEGPWEPIESFLVKTLRLSPPPTLPLNGPIPWYQRQAARLRHMAPTILNFESLAGELPGDTRSRVYKAFKAQALKQFDWPLAGGW